MLLIGCVGYRAFACVFKWQNMLLLDVHTKTQMPIPYCIFLFLGLYSTVVILFCAVEDTNNEGW